MRRLLMTLGMALAVLMPMAANFAVAGALPQIEGDLARATLDPRWVQSVYLIVFTAFMLAGGSLGDRFGRKRLLLWGLVLFIASSIACGFCQNIDQLVGARAVQGFGAALLVPATLSNLVAAFPDKGRGAALGLWAAMSAIGVLYGPLFSAYVLESYSWQWIFYSMAAVAGAGMLLAFAAKETRDRSLLRRLDFVGVVVGGCALGLFSYAMSEGNLVGWRNEFVLGALAAAALLVVIFALIETRRRHPIVTLWYSGHATFSGANAVAAAAFFTLIAISLLLLAYLRTVLGYPTEEAAQRLLPLAGALLVVSPVAGMISDRLGSRALMTYGCLLAAGGLGLLLQADLEPAYQNVVLPALVLMGFGLGLVVGPMTTAATGVVDPGRVGGASGVNNSVRQLGMLLGVALLTTVVASAFDTSLIAKLVEAGADRTTAETIADSDLARAAAMGGPLEPLRDLLPPGTASGVVDGTLRAAQESFVDGFHIAMLLSIGFLLLAALISVVFVRSHVVSLFRVDSGSPEDSKSGAAEKPAAAEPMPPAPSPSDPAPTPSVPVNVEPVEAKPEIEEAEPEPVNAEPINVEPEIEEAEPEPVNAEPINVEPEIEEAEPEPETTSALPVEEVVAQDLEEEEDSMVSMEEVMQEDLEETREADLERAEEALVALVADPQEPPAAPAPPGELAMVLFQFPFRAGSGTVEGNITDFIESTSSYYEGPVAPDRMVELPETISGIAGARTSQDIATLAGYLLLEQRFGRIRPGVRLDLAATALIGAARSRSLWSFTESDSNGAPDGFLEGLVALILQGLGTGSEETVAEDSSNERPLSA